MYHVRFTVTYLHVAYVGNWPVWGWAVSAVITRSFTVDGQIRAMVPLAVAWLAKIWFAPTTSDLFTTMSYPSTAMKCWLTINYALTLRAFAWFAMISSQDIFNHKPASEQSRAPRCVGYQSFVKSSVEPVVWGTMSNNAVPWFIGIWLVGFTFFVVHQFGLVWLTI